MVFVNVSINWFGIRKAPILGSTKSWAFTLYYWYTVLKRCFRICLKNLDFCANEVSQAKQSKALAEQFYF